MEKSDPFIRVLERQHTEDLRVANEMAAETHVPAHECLEFVKRQRANMVAAVLEVMEEDLGLQSAYAEAIKRNNE